MFSIAVVNKTIQSISVHETNTLKHVKGVNTD